MNEKAKPDNDATALNSKRVAQKLTTPEVLSGAIISVIQTVDSSQINEIVDELKTQSSLVHGNDMRRAESMLTAQAHTLDALFAKLISKALACDDSVRLERHMRLALKAQSQSRATLQTLGELKAPKHVAFVRQANIGNQVQVNNETASPAPARARKNKKSPNKLMEVNHGERLDTRATSSTSGVDSAMATLEAQHWTD
tara:strand:+ start:5463 stop:6059 length:597 start_codon:yes stop_codon:yes gene_type:complete